MWSGRSTGGNLSTVVFTGYLLTCIRSNLLSRVLQNQLATAHGLVFLLTRPASFPLSYPLPSIYQYVSILLANHCLSPSAGKNSHLTHLQCRRVLCLMCSLEIENIANFIPLIFIKFFFLKSSSYTRTMT